MKNLRVLSRTGWSTKPPENLPENKLLAQEVDANFLALEDQPCAGISAFATEPPVPPVDLQRFIVGAGATGAFAGHELQIAQYDATTASWLFYSPATGWVVWVDSEQAQYVFSGGTWIEAAAPSAPPVSGLVQEAGGVTAGQAVVVNNGMVTYADVATAYDGFIGIAETTQAFGTTVVVQREGIHVAAPLSYTPGDRVYLDAAGAITQVEPTTGILLVLGIAISTDQMYVDVREPIAL